MTQIRLGVAGDAGVVVESKEWIACEWKNCRKTHSNKLEYPDDGVFKYSSNYKSNWVNAGKEPWKLYKDGNNTKGRFFEYKNETPKANYLNNAANMTHPEYHTQKHHLIPVKSFDDFKALKHDAKLVGYDVNHEHNGACLPTYTLDIARHDLQRHRGRHSMKAYKAEVASLLRGLENRAKRYCVLDPVGELVQQNRLVGDLDRQSTRIYDLIKTWRLLLSSDARIYRKQSYDRFGKL